MNAPPIKEEFFNKISPYCQNAATSRGLLSWLAKMTVFDIGADTTKVISSQKTNALKVLRRPYICKPQAQKLSASTVE